ncbi:hypothetical protein FSP39_021736 [Pinctada imbricata]|uniref:Protein trunk n=1 Tax=Pinctada imbricata TaxID=66713 RepID=A0AA88XGL0_PINIB|nr:hypothetical protein FSP39_021736 [Pinctada imbricata]
MVFITGINADYSVPFSLIELIGKRQSTRQINNELSYEINDEPKMIEPFSPDVQLPWSCDLATHWRDLGEGHHPRHIREERCLNSTCWYGHYRCQQVTYPAKILVRNFINANDGKLPQELRADWRFQSHDISVGCICSR